MRVSLSLNSFKRKWKRCSKSLNLTMELIVSYWRRQVIKKRIMSHLPQSAPTFSSVHAQWCCSTFPLPSPQSLYVISGFQKSLPAKLPIKQHSKMHAESVSYQPWCMSSPCLPPVNASRYSALDLLKLCLLLYLLASQSCGKVLRK